MILPQNPDLAVFIPQTPAIHEERQFRGERDGDGDHGREMEVPCAVRRIVSHKFADRFHYEDEGDGGHEEAEGNVAGCFDTRFA
jgi:hypothetical protein